MNTNQSVLLVAGGSGAGKRTFIDRLLIDRDFQLSVSGTTRKRRLRIETHGVHYWFFRMRKFKKLIRRGHLLEWAFIHQSDYYGTLLEPTLAAINAGKRLLFEVDVQGHEKLRQCEIPQICDAMKSVFIKVKSAEVLTERILLREPQMPADKLAKRLKSAEIEDARAGEFDRIVVNDILEPSYAEFLSIVDEWFPDAKRVAA